MITLAGKIAYLIGFVRWL